MNRPGYIALISVLILSAIGLSLVIGLLTRSTSSSQMSLHDESAVRAQAAAGACAEKALDKLKKSLNYSGNETFNVTGDECRILAVGGHGYINRTVSVSSTVMGATHLIYIDISTVNPTMSIRSWQDVLSF